MVIATRPARAPVPELDGGPLRMATLDMAADQRYLPLVRTSVAQIGAVLHLPPDRLADLRLAVNEACACFLDAGSRDQPDDPFGLAAPDEIEVAFDLYPAELHVSVRAAAGEDWPDAGALEWIVLSNLPGEVHAQRSEGLGVITLVEPLSLGG